MLNTKNQKRTLQSPALFPLFRKAITPLIYLFMIAPYGHSANTNWTWNGTNTTAWGTKSNWSTTDNNASPGNGDTVIIPNGKVRYPTLTGNVTVSCLRLKGGSVNLSNRTLTVGYRSYLDSGTITMNAATLTANGTTYFRSAKFNCTSNSAANFVNLELVSPDTISISAKLAMKISGKLTFTSGKLIIPGSSNFLAFADNSTITGSGSNSYVIGKVRKIGNDSFMFPVGSLLRYAPVYMSAPSSTAHHFTVEYLSSPYIDTSSKNYGITRISKLEYWDIARTNGTSQVYLSLSWNTVLNSGVSDSSTLILCHWNSSTNSWESVGGKLHNGSNNKNGIIRSSAKVSSFSPFTFGSGSTKNPLPLKSTSLSAFCNNNLTVIEFSLLSDEPKQLQLEGSTNGDHWSLIKNIQTSHRPEKTSYRFTDSSNTTCQERYYRLVSENKTIEQILFGKAYDQSIGLALKAFPNPTKDDLTLSLPFEGDWNILILDLYGNPVLEELSCFCQNYTLNTKNLKPGIYTVIAESLGHQYCVKTIKS